METRGEGPTPSSSSKARPGIPERAFALKPWEPAGVETVEFALGPQRSERHSAKLAMIFTSCGGSRPYRDLHSIDAVIGIAKAEAIKVIRHIDRAA